MKKAISKEEKALKAIQAIKGNTKIVWFKLSKDENEQLLKDIKAIKHICSEMGANMMERIYSDVSIINHVICGKLSKDERCASLYASFNRKLKDLKAVQAIEDIEDICKEMESIYADKSTSIIDLWKDYLKQEVGKLR